MNSKWKQYFLWYFRLFIYVEEKQEKFNFWKSHNVFINLWLMLCRSKSRRHFACKRVRDKFCWNSIQDRLMISNVKINIYWAVQRVIFSNCSASWGTISFFNSNFSANRSKFGKRHTNSDVRQTLILSSLTTSIEG